MSQLSRGWPRLEADELPWLLAHRGGHGAWRENTLEAFTSAFEAGADGVELDVRRTGDRSLVVLHDAIVQGIGPVHELRAEELPEWVPTLAEALDACSGAAVNVEIKNSPADPGFDPSESAAREVVEAIEAVGTAPASPSGADGSPAHVVISSFSPATLVAARATGTEVPLGLLVHPALDPHAALAEAVNLGLSALNPFHGQVDLELVTRAHDEGLGVMTWTVNDPSALRDVLAAGVDGVITDLVPLAREVLGGGGGLVRDRGRRGQSRS